MPLIEVFRARERAKAERAAAAGGVATAKSGERTTAVTTPEQEQKTDPPVGDIKRPQAEATKLPTPPPTPDIKAIIGGDGGGSIDTNATEMSNAEDARLLSESKKDTRINISTTALPEGADACEDVPLVGFYNGHKVFRAITKTEKLLRSVRTWTPLGIRYVREPVVDCSKPSSLLLTEETGLASTRRFRNGYFQVRKSPLSGFGAFACRDLKYGQVILLEAPLVITNQLDIYRDVSRLNAPGREAFYSLHPFHRDPLADMIQQIFDANSFYIDPRSCAVFGVAANFNHACRPRRNVQYLYDSNRKVLVLVVIRDVAAGTELLISYSSNAAHLRERYGFACQCGACPPEASHGRVEKKDGDWW